MSAPLVPPGFIFRYAVRLPNGELAIGPFHNPWNWTEKDTALKALGYFAEAARNLGLTDWSGEVVHQLCTPWIGENDNAGRLLCELSDWLDAQTGAN